MNRMDPPDPAVRTLLRDAAVDLRNIALTVDRASAVLDPTLELLEASHAIHRALVLMVDWNSEQTDGGSERSVRVDQLGRVRFHRRASGVGLQTSAPPALADYTITPDDTKGPFLASIMLGVADVAGKYYVPKLGAFAIYTVMIVVLIWRPQGLFARGTTK